MIKIKTRLGISFSQFLLFLAALLWSFPSGAQESMTFAKEADKLDYIREMVKKEKVLDYRNNSPEDAIICKPLMEGFLADNGIIKVIEPVARADSEDDPVLEKWHSCSSLDCTDSRRTPEAYDKCFTWLSYLGHPPYRYYRLELDGNPKNGLEDMIYHNSSSDPVPYNQTGYTWVDLERCMIMYGFPATTRLSSFSPKDEDGIYLNTLIYYRGRIWAVDYVEGRGISFYRREGPEGLLTCRWNFYTLDP
jgi:hypothetical protein